MPSSEIEAAVVVENGSTLSEYRQETTKNKKEKKKSAADYEYLSNPL